jgi:uncharacterized protein (DUF2141 family)
MTIQFRCGLSALALLVTPLAMAEPLSLSIKGVSSDKGQVVIQVYSNSKNWMSDKAGEILLQQKVPAAQLLANTEVVLPLAYGSYAIQVYHDTDSNNELKTNWIGIPREPVGISNNAKGKMGPPSFKDAVFVFDEKNTSHQLDIVNIE